MPLGGGSIGGRLLVAVAVVAVVALVVAVPAVAMVAMRCSRASSAFLVRHGARWAVVTAGATAAAIVHVNTQAAELIAVASSPQVELL